MRALQQSGSQLREIWLAIDWSIFCLLKNLCDFTRILLVIEDITDLPVRSGLERQVANVSGLNIFS